MRSSVNRWTAARLCMQAEGLCRPANSNQPCFLHVQISIRVSSPGMRQLTCRASSIMVTTMSHWCSASSRPGKLSGLKRYDSHSQRDSTCRTYTHECHHVLRP